MTYEIIYNMMPEVLAHVLLIIEFNLNLQLMTFKIIYNMMPEVSAHGREQRRNRIFY